MTEESREDLQIDYEVKTPRCRVCNDITLYSGRWDAYLCKSCNKWMSPPCSATPSDGKYGCMIQCWDRPKRPFVVKKD